jgi:polysaccharide export outer membrane protein
VEQNDVSISSGAALSPEVVETGSYLINAGDVLSLQVWNEATLSDEQLLVRPDGFISAPVIGELRAGGKKLSELQEMVETALAKYLKDPPTVVINLLGTGGSRIFILGKVQRPGGYPLNGPMDVTQALSLAGGLNSFAAENKIKVLRRDKSGVQSSIKFKYGQVKDGEKLSSNILLKSGDVVLVP